MQTDFRDQHYFPDFFNMRRAAAYDRKRAMHNRPIDDIRNPGWPWDEWVLSHEWEAK